MTLYKFLLPFILLSLFSVSSFTIADPVAVPVAPETDATQERTELKKTPVELMCEELEQIERLPGGYLGADICLSCHDDKEQVLSKNVHGQSYDYRTPFGQKDCENCHGTGVQHIQSENKECMISLKGTYGEEVSERNAVCMSCHKGGDFKHWFASSHESEDLACASCHSIHKPDAVVERSTQAEVCYQCHQNIRAETHRASTHPIREGKVICTDCHTPHSSTEPFSLKQFSVNQNCYSCHAEKRGPFLWEHYPVSEDCTLCHRVHGSNHQALLNKPGPQMCQQCHATQARGGGTSHISRFQDFFEANDARRARFSLGSNCANCHSKVHGSNHPSGASLQR